MSINQWTQNWANNHSQLDCLYTQSTESTNLWAKNQVLNRDTVLLADEQTKGKGRGSNSWTNTCDGSTLLSTWFFIAESPQPVFAARIGLALFDALSKTWPSLNFSLKAPNDIYLNSGKLSGILIELEPQTKDCCFYVGVGLNATNSPQVDGQITSFLQQDVELTKESWATFCDEFYNNLQQVKRTSGASTLSDNERAFILEALNKHPEKSYQDIHADGSLVGSDGSIVHWQDL